MQVPVTHETPGGATCCWVSAKIQAASFSIELKAFMLHYGSGNLDKIPTGRNVGLNFKAPGCGGQEEEQEKLTFKPNNKSNHKRSRRRRSRAASKVSIFFI